ncbi:isoaspartyl peptidase L-asparaginase-like [Paramuricea clavata]|uniref:Isoaspartyl peptidase L-asparaginase-like n=1 Tax=Paramuricea clavata TaxID=317549 RepID=A0A6S7G6T2_PARCT|nr:isoaspartyl peptidase L-asparaginase-like [Paramuricea clavata]
MPPDNKWEYKRATKESARKGYDILMNGGTAVEAVEAAVRDLENNEYFNAGYGSLLNNDGEVECDAMIMEGHTLRYGAVISGRHFKNPVSLSKIIMYESSHCALSGDGALQFAQRKGFPKCDPGELISELAREKVKVSYEDYLGYVKYYYGSKPLGKETHDTVSAVAMDTYGHLACAMSTGTCKSLLFGLQNIYFQKLRNLII